MKKKLVISGMTCMHCVMHVQDALKELNGVTDAKVDLAGNSAVVELSDNVSDDALKAVVADAGYEVTSIENI